MAWYGMPRIRTLATLLLLASLATPADTSAQPAFSGRAPSADSLLGPGVSQALARHRAARVRDTRYELSLDVRGADTARGTVVVRWTSSGAGDAILDFRGLTLEGVTANGTTLDERSAWNGAHIVIPARLVKPGHNEARLAFATSIAPSGAAIIRTKDATDGATYLYTLLVPSDANLLFPCFDQPDLKARVMLSVTAPSGWRVLGNGAAINEFTGRAASAPQGHDTWVEAAFRETQPISTYLIAFAAGPWQTVSRSARIGPSARDSTVPVSLWVRASRLKEVEADTLIAMNARALRWLGTYFGVPYPFGKYDLLLAPAFPFGGMEHPGAVFYNEESFIYRERPTTNQLLGRQATTYHEVAHQLFGDYVTMRWFDDLWLKEGFATFMAARVQDELAPSSNAWKTFYLRNKPVAYGTDATLGTTPVWQSLANLDQAKSNYGPIVYNKAPSILRQLEYAVGAAPFQRGVASFLAANSYGNATWRELLSHIGQAAGRDLTGWGASWILRPGMPIVEQHLETRGGRITRLRLVQRAAQPTVSGKGAWPLAMQTVLHYPGADPVRIPVTLTGDTTEVDAARGRPAPAFAFANERDYGYALVLPDSASVRWLASHIGEVEDDFLRTMLWGSLWDLVREARLAPSRFARVALDALPAERDEQLAASLVGRVLTATTRYASEAARDSLEPSARRVFARGAADSTRPYGTRKAQLDALIGLADAPAALAEVSRWLDADSALGLPLRAPTRWAIVVQLASRAAPDADSRLAAESRRDSTTEGRRQAFVALAARPDSLAKHRMFTRWFEDRELNEEWVTSSLRAFHDPEHRTLTLPYLTAALDTLPWIQQNRRIFFLGSWLGATLGGQRDSEALAAVDAWLRRHQDLAADLRQKVLQARDELERTVAIRRTFGG